MNNKTEVPPPTTKQVIKVYLMVAVIIASVYIMYINS